MSGGEAEVSAGGWLAGSCVLAGRWQALSTRHKGRARQRALRLRDGAIEIPREVRADVMVSSTHRKQYASRIFKESLCVQTPSRHRLKNASALFLCNSSCAGLGSSPSARHTEAAPAPVIWGATFTPASEESHVKGTQ